MRSIDLAQLRSNRRSQLIKFEVCNNEDVSKVCHYLSLSHPRKIVLMPQFLQNGFCNQLAVEQVNDATCKSGIVLAVRNHNDGRSLLVQFHQQIHHFFSVF